MAEVFHVTVRDHSGKYHTRRLRRAGQVPAVLYGHGKKNVHLAIPAEEVLGAVRHGGHLVDLRGVLKESALIREVQWDAFGTDVLHLDLARVRATEQVHATVAVDLRGEAPGTKEGGVVEHYLHEVEIECPARSIPEKLEVNINTLQLGQVILAKDLRLPKEARLLIDPNEVVVHCVEPRAEEEEELAPVEAGEPEVIRREREEEEEEGGE